MTKTTRTGRLVALGLTALLVGPLTWSQPAVAHSTRQSLTGLFRLQAGSWSGGANGSYFRMLQPDGKTYLTNTSSTAGDKSFTLLSAGTDGGLRTGTYQATPSPAFAGNGDALSGKVTAPTDFFGVKFATATNRSDPQTGQRTASPAVYVDGTRLSGNLSAFAASWNNQHFNQGSPKPNGSSPGFTRSVSGTYNPSSRAYTLSWRSLIVDGPFNKFTGEWHLTGTFVPARTTKPKPSPSMKKAGAPPVATKPKPRAHSSAAPRTSAAKTAPSTPVASGSRRASATASASGAPTSGSRAAVTAAPATTGADPVLTQGTPSASRIAARTVADRKDDSSRSPWLVVGGVVVLALLGLLTFRIVRSRASAT